MALCKQILEVIVAICVTTGTALGVIKFVKAYKKEKREAKIRANQHLVKAEYRKGQAARNRVTLALYVINTDTRPVTGVHVDFLMNGTPRSSKDYGSLGPKEEVLIDESPIGLGIHKYESARFTYTDADGRKHEYEQHTT